MVARRSWKRGSGDEQLRSYLNLITEVKTMRGYHLVFAPLPDSERSVIVEREWLGYASERGPHRVQLGRALERAEIGAEEIASIFEGLFSLAYPGELMVIIDLVAGPPPAPFVSSAFRETNIGGEKDIDTSVLLKAAQALNDCVAYSRTAYLERALEDVEGTADYARWQGDSIVEGVLRELTKKTNRVELFHSVVVVDAMIWGLRDTALEELPWCRFYQLEGYGFVTGWYDIVRRDSLQQYFTEITTHYDEYMRQAGAQPG